MRKEIREFKMSFNTSFPERDPFCDALLMSRIAGEHLLVLGPPGTAKTTSVTAFARSLGEKSFYVQLHRQLPETDIFGPVDPAQFKKGAYVRKHEGYAPTADIVILDEVFKAGPTSLNPLLTLLESRTVKQDGADLKVPLKFAVGISNELPGDGEDLSAFHDRFPTRVWVDYVKMTGSFNNIMDGTLPPLTDKIPAKLIADLSATAASLPISQAVADARLKIVMEARERGIAVSDRRVYKATKLMRAMAAMQEASEVTTSQLSVLQHVLWNKKEEIPVVKDILNKHASPWLRAVQAANKVLDEIKASLSATLSSNLTRDEAGSRLLQITTKYKTLREEELPRIKAHGSEAVAAAAEIEARIKAESREVIAAGVRLGIGTFAL